MSIHERDVARRRDRVKHRTERRGTPVERLEVPVSSSELFAPSLGASTTRTSTRNCWSRAYLRRIITLDVVIGVLCSIAAAAIRFNDSYVQAEYCLLYTSRCV